MQKHLLSILLLLFIPFFLVAQQDGFSNKRSKNIAFSSELQAIGSLTVVPESLTLFIDKKKLDSAFYHFGNNQLQLDSIQIDSFFENKNPIFQANFRVLPYNLAATFNHLDSSLSIIEGRKIIGFEYDPYAKNEAGIIEFQGLDYNGTFARGISFGNNQNLVLNSAFNLQLAGNLGDGVEILAAISDNNIPLQPEGNTQQLNEFDKIFIQISKDNNKLIAGDYELGVRPPQSYFMNYFKKMQGATYSNISEVFKKKGILSSGASIAISRGKTARQDITAEEGNQGPYRLEGAEGERFIIVLAGTERVWIDGKLMTRGLEEDYVIDYNAGDITFTPRRLITKDSRIIIEFEYSVDNYTRSMYAGNFEYKQGDKFRAYLNIFSEQDGKIPVDDEFSAAERDSLFNAGDDPFSATTTGINRVDEYTAFRVLYKLIANPHADICGAPDSVLIYSTNPDSALYAARFSLVQAGTGFYSLDADNLANGQVYEYTGCEIRGNYIARISIITPKQQQLYTLGAEYEFSKNNRFRSEIALSNQDLNRISPKDDGDNVGLAAFTNFENDFNLNKNLRLETEVSYEYKQSRFEDLNPYRTAEFTRDWNINSINSFKATEHLGSGSLRLRSKKSGTLEYNFSGFFRDSLYEGLKHVATYSFLKNGWEIRAEGNLLETKETEETSRFFRPTFTIVMPIFRDSTGKKFWRIGMTGEREQNERYTKFGQNQQSDTLQSNSFNFDVYNVFIETPKNDKINFLANFRQRLDYAPAGQDFAASTVGSEVNIQSSFRNRRKNKNKRRFLSTLGINFTYRQLEIKNETLTSNEPSETFLGRLNHNWSLYDGSIQTNTTYEVGSGQERKIEFFFDENQEGTGAYIWNDYNIDSVIQVSEVEISPFGNGTVDRFVRYTDEFIRTNNVVFNQSIRLEPKAIWFSEKKGFKKLLTKLSTQSSLQISRKVRDDADVSPWNPFQLNIADTTLVSTNSNIRNTLFFNRADPKFDIQVGMSINEIKSLLSSGFDSRRTDKQFLKWRWNLSKTFSTTAEISQNRKQRVNETTTENNFNIESYMLQPTLRWQPKKNFRMGVSYAYESSENTVGDNGESSTKHDLGWELKFNKSSKTSVETEFSFVKVAFDGETNSAVGFAFLNGLQNGNNYLWNVTIDRKLARNIQLSIGYEGRKTGTARVIHVGRAQMAATF
jgi:hypothetical protein